MIGELQAALDYEKGGEIAASLNQLYSYMLSRLASANYDQKIEPLNEVLQLLGTLQSAWAQARVEYNQLPASGQFGKNQGAAAVPAAVR
jgi:flagellar protein FliS